jgi:hypothetical protein
MKIKIVYPSCIIVLFCGNARLYRDADGCGLQALEKPVFVLTALRPDAIMMNIGERTGSV